MAIIKFVEAPNGATGNYIKISKVEIFADEGGMVTITTNIYASEEARDEGKNILWQERTNIPYQAFTQDPRIPFYHVLQDYSFSPFKDGSPDTEVPAGTNTVELTPEAQTDVDYGAVIPNYTPDPSATNTFDAWDKTTMVADGVEQATVLNLPNPTTVTFLKVPPGVAKPLASSETTGTFGFATTVPGNYTIQLDAFTYLSSIVTITATEAP